MAGRSRSCIAQIMLSDTYALERAGDGAEQDEGRGQHVCFWRANRRRLDAESLRDSMLFVSGKLDTTPAEGAS